jgi:CBS domain-containing protein
MKISSINLTTSMLDKLTKFFVFKGIEYSRLRVLLDKAELVIADKGEIVFKKGETYHKGIYLVYDGEVELYTESGVRDSAEPGNFAGLSNFVGKSVYHVNAISVKPSELIFIPEMNLYTLMEFSEEFRDRFYGLVTHRINILSGKENSNSIESTSYKPLGSYMTSPIITVKSDETVVNACKIMAEHHIGALVVLDKEEKLAGIITTKHLVHGFLANVGTEFNNPSVSEFMETSPIVPPEFPLAEVLGEMQTKHQEYAIVGRHRKPIGIISNNNIMRTLFRNTTVHNMYIEGMTSLDELKAAHQSLFKITEGLMGSSRLTYNILPVISAIHLNIQKKVYRLSAEQFKEETGFDIYKVRHTQIIMGSGGRKEMMLDPDQDNGFIFDDDVTDEQIAIFMDFGKILIDNLDYVGYEKCKGNVMVTNPAMSMRISDWKNTVRNWIDGASNESILWSNIVFDFDGLIGDDKLVWELREYINLKIFQKPLFIIQMLEVDLGTRKPMNIFGKFVTEKEGAHKGELNLKVAALSFIVDVTRAFSLKFGLNDLNTIERLRHLKRKKVLSDEIVSQTQDAYEVLVDIGLNEQIRKALNNEPMSKYVDPDTLSLYNQEKLKKALNHVSKFLNMGVRYFKGLP